MKLGIYHDASELDHGIESVEEILSNPSARGVLRHSAITANRRALRVTR